MIDKPPLSRQSPEDAAAGEQKRTADAQVAGTLDQPWRDYVTACSILDNIEMMIELADRADLSEVALTTLQQAKAEAERVIRCSGVHTPSTRKH